MLRNIRIVLWVLVLGVGLAATAYYLIRPPQQPIGNFGGDFEVSRSDGTPFTRQSLEGTPSLVFFGFTFCPDVCPTTLFETVSWREGLNLSAEDLNIVFVTVDPERDTLESVQTYVDIFGDVIALRGDEAQTEQIKKAFGVVAERVDDPGASDYLINHTASVFMLDRNADFVSTIAFGESRDAALGKIENLMTR